MGTDSSKPSPEKKYKVDVLKKPGSLVFISGSISPEIIADHKTAALKQISADIELPGFRKGHVPGNIIEQKIGEIGILEEAAGIVLEEIVPEILIQESIQIITRPSIRITKLVPGHPVEYSITVPVMPEVKLPDFKKIAKKYKPATHSNEVTEKEVAEALLNVRKTVTEWKRRKAGDQEKVHTHTHDGHVHKPGEVHDHEHVEEKKSPKKETEVEPPTLTDDDVKMIGEYKDVADFTEKLKQSLITEKEKKAKDKRRGEIAEGLIAETNIDIPDVMIEDEQHVMLERFKHDIEDMGMKFDQYIKEIKKTEEDLKKEWLPDAKKRVTLELVLSKIARDEKLEVNTKELEEEVKHYLQMMPGTDETRVREHIRHLMLKEEVFKMLEK